MDSAVSIIASVVGVIAAVVAVAVQIFAEQRQRNALEYRPDPPGGAAQSGGSREDDTWSELRKEVTKLRKELQELRESHEDLLQQRASQRYASSVASSEDYISAIDGFEDVSISELEEIDALLTGYREGRLKAYAMLLDRYNMDQSDREVLWRLAEACMRMVVVTEDTHRKDFYMSKGLDFAKMCLDIAPNSSNSHKWYAVCIGVQCSSKPPKERIENGLKIEKHILTALRLNPEDASLYHLLGRFQFEVASLSWMEKKVATAMYGSIPQATMEEALESLKKADRLSDPPSKEIRVLVAKAYLNKKDNSRSKEWLRKADEITSTSPEDDLADGEIGVLKKKLNI